jgi:hypothetical protein
MYGSKPVSVIATVTLIPVACTDLKARKKKGEGKLSPTFWELYSPSDCPSRRLRRL